MENRLELNKKKIYKLPDEVIVEEYRYSKDKKRYGEPNFEPDICITAFGVIRETMPKKTVKQVWVKTDNKALIEFIRGYDFGRVSKNKITNSYNLAIWEFKKIILEEFYGIKE